MPVGVAVAYIDFTADIWGVTLDEAVKLIADIEFPDIKGTEFDCGPLPLQEQSDKIIWPDIPRNYLDRGHLRRFYHNKLVSLIQSGEIVRCCDFTKCELSPGWPRPEQLLTLVEFEKFAKTVNKSVVVRIGATNPKQEAPSKKPQPESAWIPKAKEIGAELSKKFPRLSLEQISAKVGEEMRKRHEAGELGMTGRGGRIPSASSIKRHALTGIKA